MKTIAFISPIFLAAATLFAAGDLARPESIVPTPAENTVISKETPDLGTKERADWQKLRAERKAAREQILSKIRESSAADKERFRQESAKKGNEKFRFEGESQKLEPRERGPFYEQPDSHNMDPMRGMPGPAQNHPWGPMHHK